MSLSFIDCERKKNHNESVNFIKSISSSTSYKNFDTLGLTNFRGH